MDVTFIQKFSKSFFEDLFFRGCRLRRHI